MSKKDESINSAEIAHVVRVLLGPEEEWDSADGRFVMKLYGIESENSTKESCDLVLGAIQKFRERRQEVPLSLVNILTQLASKLKREDPRVATTLDELKERHSKRGTKAFKAFAAAAVDQRFRGKTKLSKKDERILQELSDELLREAQGEN